MCVVSGYRVCAVSVTSLWYNFTVHAALWAARPAVLFDCRGRLVRRGRAREAVRLRARGAGRSERRELANLRMRLRHVMVSGASSGFAPPLANMYATGEEGRTRSADQDDVKTAWRIDTPGNTKQRVTRLKVQISSRKKRQQVCPTMNTRTVQGRSFATKRGKGVDDLVTLLSSVPNPKAEHLS